MIEQGMINGFELDIETIEDSFEKSIAKYEFPYRDGVLLEDLGQKARIIKLRCYFYNEKYENHIYFINMLKEQDLFEFIHPKYGLIYGSIESINVRHDERIRTAEIDITFIENLRTEIEIIPQIEIAETCEELFIEGQEELIEELKESLLEELDSSIVNMSLDPTKSILEQISSVSTTVKGVIKSIDSAISSMQSIMNQVMLPANSLISMIDYAVNIPGRIISTISTVVERYATAYQSLVSAPERFMQSFENSINELSSQFGKFSKEIKTCGSQRMALSLAYIFAEDQEKREKVKKKEKKQNFDILGNFQKDDIEPILTINEIEKSLYIVRKKLQESINYNRNNTSLKKMARVLLEYTNTIKLEREKIKKLNISRPMPLHLICLQNNLPYSFAERILSINDIPNPNFVHGDVNIYAR
jgi:prophage DNA circulation protein